MSYGWISFTTDYGLEDGFVGACVGVIARIAPAARLIQVTHAVAPHDIRHGATVLAQTVPYLPPAVHLAVVDPGVGTSRRPVVVVAPDALLVGPDNGLLLPAAEALGGVLSAYELTEPRYRLPAVSATFHGRDIFAPAAAHLAAGVLPHRLGPPVHPGTLARLKPPKTVASHGKLSTEVLGVDRFGNVQLAAAGSDLDGLAHTRAVHVRAGYRDAAAILGRTFADAPAGIMVVLVDSAGHVALAVNGGSAAAELRCAAGDSIVLTTTR
ncbi:MAG: S-adenosyl-l-methionine hydroxide adenosyltransferase family protein [Labedaea sp.]